MAIVIVRLKLFPVEVRNIHSYTWILLAETLVDRGENSQVVGMGKNPYL